MKRSVKNMAAVLVLVGCMLINGIYAYFTDNDTIINKITIGSVNTQIVEEFDPPVKIEPNTEFVKDVKVRNTGISDCYVRVRVLFSDNYIEKNCSINWNEENWTYKSSDGYWYYTRSLKAGEETESLFTKVSLSSDFNIDDISVFDIYVYHESYQSGGHADYEEAWDYYKRNKPNQ